MKIGFGIAAAILALALTTVTPSAQACNYNGNCPNAPGHNKEGPGNVSGAPGPIAGAGLPVLAIGFGCGVYWLVKRRRKPTVI
jgi:hypothetical protein